MLPFTGRRDGHYNDNGDWQREKICFIYCGDRCTCTPPNGIWHIDINNEEDENSKDNQI